jgi:hypothetical protein
MSFDRWMLAAACLAGGLAALHFGFALEWDLLNYHFYNPHALFTGRQAIDVVPAQLQSFLNPALYLPLYLLFKYLGPVAMVFIIGAIQAGQLLLLVMILQQLTGQRLTDRWILLPVAALGLAGPVFLHQLGGTQGDTLLSLPVLAGFLLVATDLSRADGARTVQTGLMAGLLLGAAVAMKLTFAIYAVSVGLAAIVCFDGSRRWRMAFSLILGGILGAALTGGAWFIHLWQQYGNPLFPYFNDVFNSPYVNSEDFRDLRFMPRSMVEWLLYPLYWLQDPYRVWEWQFRDIRMLLVLALVFLMPVFTWRRMRGKAPALGFAWVFVGISYLLWLRLFSIYRYLSVIEMLAPVVIFASVFLLSRSRRVILVTLAVLLSTQFLVHYHRGDASWEFRPGTDTLLAALPADAMVLIASYEPVAYAALWMSDEIPLVRTRANFMRTSQPQHKLHEMAHFRVRQHSGPFYLLLSRQDVEAGFLQADLAEVGLALADEGVCKAAFESSELQQKLGLEICPLERLP